MSDSHQSANPPSDRTGIAIALRYRGLYPADPFAGTFVRRGKRRRQVWPVPDPDSLYQCILPAENARRRAFRDQANRAGRVFHEILQELSRHALDAIDYPEVNEDIASLRRTSADVGEVEGQLGPDGYVHFPILDENGQAYRLTREEENRLEDDERADLPGGPFDRQWALRMIEDFKDPLQGRHNSSIQRRVAVYNPLP